VSVVISSFNYERFVGEAIRSALEQVGAETEVIVVDDGSTDGSREVIEGFGALIEAIFKENRGQASALNTGFERSSGEAVIFLDSDDLLLPGAASAVARALADRSAAKAHWSMPVLDGQGRRTGRIQDPVLAEGDLRRHVLDEGPLCDATIPNPPMSGNAFARSFLERVMPIPEQAYVTSPDEYLFGLAPAFGRIVRLPSQSLYRLHGENAHIAPSFEHRLAFQEEHYAIVAATIADAWDGAGAPLPRAAWGRSAWWLRSGRAVRAIDAAIPTGERLALLDEAALGVGHDLRGRRVVALPESDGEFGGRPASDAEALAGLERARAEGIRYFAVAWPAFWWLEEYPRMASALAADAQLLHASDDLVVYGPAEA
jgi:hypothetical protein